MKRILFSMAFVAAAVAAFADSLVLLHTNDTHSQIDPAGAVGGILQRKALIDSIRKAEDNVLLIDAGDMVQGSLYFKYFRGEVEYPLFEMMGYDIRILGNHEFDNGMADLAREYRKIGKTDLLSANYDFRGTEMEGVMKPYVIRKVDGKKIGFFGINIDPSSLISERNIKVNFKDVIATANETAEYLKQNKKCDLVVAVTHIGYESDNGKPTDVDLARSSKDIDIIIGGHSHTTVTPGRDGAFPSIVDNAQGRPVLIAQTGKYGRNLGYIKIDLDNLKKSDPNDFDYRLIPVTNSFPQEKLDSRMARFLAPYAHKVDSVNNRVIAQSYYDMNNGERTGGLANFTGDFGKWYGDLVLDSIGPLGGHERVDLSIMNVGGIRQPMAKGPVSEGQVLSTYPFSNYMVLTALRGKDLLDVLSVAASKGGEAVSDGVRVITRDGKLYKAYLDFDEIDPEKEYLVSTINYVAEGNDDLEAMRRGKVLWTDTKEMSAPMMRYVVMMGDKSLPIAPDQTPRFMGDMP